MGKKRATKGVPGSREFSIRQLIIFVYYLLPKVAQNEVIVDDRCPFRMTRCVHEQLVGSARERFTDEAPSQSAKGSC